MYIAPHYLGSALDTTSGSFAPAAPTPPPADTATHALLWAATAALLVMGWALTRKG